MPSEPSLGGSPFARDIESNRPQRAVLLASVVLFALASTYTTKVGLALVFQDASPLERELLSWAIASAVSLFLLYIALVVADDSRHVSISRLVLAYVLVGAISIFFNFNAVYSRLAARAIEVETATAARATLRVAIATALEQCRAHYDIENLQQKVEEASAAAEMELTHNLRPGAGPRHQALRETHARLLSDLRTATASCDSISTELAAIPIPALTEGRSYEEARRSLDLAVDGLSRVSVVLQQHGLTEESTARIVSLAVADKRSVEYSLYTLFAELGKIRDGNRDRINVYRVALSAILAIVIDLPAFFALVLLRRGLRPEMDSPSRHTANLWDPPV